MGEHSHVWDGRNDSNGPVPPGLYLYRLVVVLPSEKQTCSGVAVAY